jgi:hypothetical protein
VVFLPYFPLSAGDFPCNIALRKENGMNKTDQYIIDTEKKANGLSKKDNLFIPDKDLIIKGDFFLNTHIHCRDIISYNSSRIMAKNILARDIKVNNLFTLNITSRSILCSNLVTEGHVKATKLRAHSILARDIDVEKINYILTCCAIFDIKCNKIKREYNQEPNHFSLNGKIIIEDN